MKLANMIDGFNKTQKRIHRPRNFTPSLEKASSAPHNNKPTPTALAINRKSSFEIRSRKKNISQIDNSRYSKADSSLSLGKKKQKNSSMNSGYLSHFYHLLKKGNEDEQVKTEGAHSSAQQLKQHLSRLTSPNNRDMIPSMHIRRKSSKSKALESLPSSKEKKKDSESILSVERIPGNPFPSNSYPLPDVSSKYLKEYTEYIESKNHNYFTRINYDQYRKEGEGKFSITSQVDLKECKLVESLCMCVIDGLKQGDKCSPALIQEYCLIYFQNQQRRVFQVIFNHHILKSFFLKIKSLYAYHRIAFFMVYKLSQYRLIFQQDQVYSDLAVRAISSVESSMKIMLNAVMDLNSNSDNVIEAFRSLKIVKQLQKCLTSFESIVQALDKLLALPSEEKEKQLSQQPDLVTFCNQFTIIMANFRPFLIENSMAYRFEEYLNRTETILTWKYLKVCPVPYLPQKVTPTATSYRKYTLVIGLNNLLVYYNPNTRILKYRPFMDSFLNEVREKFQIVLFSDMEKEMTDRIVREIQKEEENSKLGINYRIFEYRLYHSHLSFYRSKVIKDLNKLGRDLATTIILDSNESMYANCLSNGLSIEPFKPQMGITSTMQGVKNLKQSSKDSDLKAAMQMLVKLHEDQPRDVRDYLKKTKPQHFDLYRIPELNSLEENSLTISNTRKSHPQRRAHRQIQQLTYEAEQALKMDG